MKIIYKSFFKRKSNKIYLTIFIILSITLSFLLLSQKYSVNKTNEIYKGSYLYFTTNKDINLSKESNIKDYNKTIKTECENIIGDAFISNTTPIIEISNKNTECLINNQKLNYSNEELVNIIYNENLYNSLNENTDEYYYFVELKDWLKHTKTSENISKKYNIEISSMTNIIDSNNYENIIFIIKIFIIIIECLFLIIFIISIFNIIIDEKNNNNLYHYLGYSKIKILKITTTKILLLQIIPIIVLLISIILTYII